MCLLPNAGSFGMAVSTAMIFGLISLMFLDTSINMAMQPFKMLVGDMVNEKQKGLAYSIQSFLCNAGSLMGYLFPFLFTWIGINNVAAKGTVPDSVIYSFYIGSAILMLCVIYTSVKVKEMPPKEFEEFHGITADEKQEKTDFISLLKHAPKVFWTVGLVQFFSWAAFMYMWTYTNGAIADTVWNTTNVQNAGYQEAGNWVGVLFAVQAIGSVLWAVILPLFKSRKLAYSLSLLLGGCGFVSTLFFTDQYLLFISYLLIGCAWAAMLAMPFTILTNSISGKNMGAYLGLFNGTICVPQIVAAVVGGGILHLVGGKQINMLVLAGALLMIGACCVYFVKETVVHTNDK
jgi:maltose/moltooligosaccharide transporter